MNTYTSDDANSQQHPPPVVPLKPDNIPGELRARPQWVRWKWRYRPGDTKPWTKPPYNPHTGKPADSTDPATWGTFDRATGYDNDTVDPETGPYQGVGFALTPPFCAIDLDHCVYGGEIAGWAKDIISAVNSYTEFSPTGTGVRILLRAALPGRGRKAGDIEIYDRERYVTMTGWWIGGTLSDRQAEAEQLYRRVGELQGRSEVTPERAPAERPAGVPGASRVTGLADDDVIRRAGAAANGEKFAALFHRGDWESQGYGSRSEADLGLLNMLHFWVGPDRDGLDRLFRRSALWREKWDRDDYRDRTLDLVLDRSGSVYTPAVDLSALESLVAAMASANRFADAPGKLNSLKNSSNFCGRTR